MKAAKPFFTILILFLILFVVNSNAYSEIKEVIVVFSEVPEDNELMDIKMLGGEIRKKFKLIPAVAVSIPEEALHDIKTYPKVVRVDDNSLFDAKEFQKPFIGGTQPQTAISESERAYQDIEYENSWGVAKVGAAAAHDENVTGSGIKVAILDSGIDYDHPEFSGRYLGGDNFVSIDPDNHDPFDDTRHSHGTHVSGIIAAAKDGEGIVGVAPEVEIYAVKVLDGAGFGTVGALISGIEYAVEQQVDIINISIDVEIYNQSLEEACRAAYDAGFLLIAAAGNNYGGQVLYPAAFDSVIAVAGVDQDDTASPINAIGPELELVAPGVGIYSTTAGNGYDYLTGTSQACPYVTGIAALLMASPDIEDINEDGVVDNKDIRQKLQLTAYDLGETGRDDQYGFGLVNFGAASILSSNNFILKKEKRIRRERVIRTLSNGTYNIHIENTDLSRVAVKVYEDQVPARNLFAMYRFTKNGTSSVDFSIDATGRKLDVHFIPFGRLGTSADVTILPEG